MDVKFHDLEVEQNPLNGSIVGLTSHLVDLLNHLQCRQPFFCELIGANGYKVLLGIGGPRGCVQYSKVDGSPPYLMAVADEPEHSKEHFEFLTGGTLTPVASRFCAPKVRWEEV